MISKLKTLLGLSALKSGDRAPDFSAVDQAGKQHRLSDYAGRWLVLFFYPKDDSYGCTKEVCSFRDEFEGFRNLNVQVLGVSVDDVESHRVFAERHALKFPLLSDHEKSLSRDYGVLTALGVSNRVTFIIDPTGIIRDTIEWALWDSYGQKIRNRVEELSSSAPTP